MDYIACQAPLSMGFSRREYWSGLPFPSSGDLPDPGTEPMSPESPALAVGFFTAVPSANLFLLLYGMFLIMTVEVVTQLYTLVKTQRLI